MGTLRLSPAFRTTLIVIAFATMLSCRAASFTTAGDNPAVDQSEGASDSTIANPGATTTTTTPILTSPASGTGSSANSSGTTGTTNSTGTLGTSTAYTTGSVAPVTTNSTGTATSTPVLSILANGQTGSVSIAPSNPVTVSWTATGVTVCAVQPIANTGLSGSTVVTPTATTIYTLTCQSPSGPVTASVTVLVVPVTAPSVLITANGTAGSITAANGSAVAIAWQSQNATACTVQPGAFTGTSGSKSVTMGSSAAVYTVTCQGPGGTATSSVALNPANQTTLTAALTVNGATVPLFVPFGATVTVAWTSSGANACNVQPLNATTLQGSVTSGTLTTSVTYVLSCTGPNNSSYVQAIPVNVATMTPPQISLKVNGSTGPLVLAAGQTETVSWTISQATSCTLSPNIVPVSATTPTGSVQTTAASTPVTFTLGCVGPGGTATASVAVSPSVMPPTLILTANNQTGIVTVPAGTDANIVWSSTNATSCITSPGNFNALAGAVQYGPINAPAVFGVVCTGPFGTVASSVMVVPTSTTTTTTETQILTVNTSQTAITVMGNSTLNVIWTSTGAVSCGVAPFNYTGISGNQISIPITANTVVTLTCTSTTGTQTVTSIPVYVAPTTSSATITLTGNGSTGPLYIPTTNPIVELVWVSTGTTSCTFNDGSVVGPTGAKIVSVSSSTDYKLTCTTTSGSTITACLQIVVANVCYNNASMIGVNFEDEPVGNRDSDFNDFTACASQGSFSIYDTVVVSNLEQIVPFTTGRLSACSHNIRIEVHHPDGTQETPIAFDDANGTPSFNLHFHPGSTLEVYMEPLDFCYTGETHSMHDPNWAIVKANECRRTGH